MQSDDRKFREERDRSVENDIARSKELLSPPIEQDDVELFRTKLMKEHSDAWSMEKVSDLAHRAAKALPLARKIANCDNPGCTTCPANALLIAEHQPQPHEASDIERVKLEAEIRQLESTKKVYELYSHESTPFYKAMCDGLELKKTKLTNLKDNKDKTA